ncbi:MAG TPA: M20/M25/M40 family metallo-hydrolase, partial [Thermoanaerobaculia bacterium]|nr:M20/M25/M40 family metallo-hydrolase [Thermoanaerobaculia bacterium]
SGGGQGTAWIFAHHPELLRGATAVINEGGSNRRINGRTLWWGIEVAQKRPLWLEVTTHGRGGHSSNLEPHSAIHKLIAALARLLDMPPHYHLCAAARRYFEALAPLHNPFWRKIFLHLDQEIAPQGPRSAMMPGMAAWFLDTVQITRLEGGDRINVIPPVASAKIDIRLLPDTNEKEFLVKAEKAMGPEARVKVILTAPPTAASPDSGPLWKSFTRVLESSAPVVPAMISGFTDSRYFRERGIAAYGFSPFELAGKDLRGIHGPDEHIPLAAFDRGVERMRRIVVDAVTGSP